MWCVLFLVISVCMSDICVCVCVRVAGIEHGAGGTKYSRTVRTHVRSARLRQSLRQHDLQDSAGVSRQLSAGVSRYPSVWYLRFATHLSSSSHTTTIAYPDHCLHYLLPEKRHYSMLLRPRGHNYTLNHISATHFKNICVNRCIFGTVYNVLIF